MLGDPLKVLGGVELTLSNVLVPECTEGQTFDALYCDAALSEEDLPTFLALLKPNGRMVVIIEEVRSCVAFTLIRVQNLLHCAKHRAC
jgi:protein-L-isoaspartate O-methyltransferase